MKMNRLEDQCMTYPKGERMEEDPKLRILSICHSLPSMPLSSLVSLANMVSLHKRWWLSLVINHTYICL